jgi:hypothetical protein
VSTTGEPMISSARTRERRGPDKDRNKNKTKTDKDRGTDGSVDEDSGNSVNKLLRTDLPLVMSFVIYRKPTSGNTSKHQTSKQRHGQTQILSKQI